MGRDDARESTGVDGFVGTTNGTNVDGSIIVGRICRPIADRPAIRIFRARGSGRATARNAWPRRHYARRPVR